MPYNALGYLYKSEVVQKLQSRGFDIDSVQKLNLIMESMGLQEHYGNHWLPTEAGVKYTIYRGPVYDPSAWHPSLVDAVADYLRNH